MLKNKHILIFGGDQFLLDEMLPIFKDNGAEITWINSSDIIDKSNFSKNTLEFENIKTISSYEKELTKLIESLESFDGVVFALSEGSLRPLSRTKTRITTSLFEVNCASFIELIRILQKKKKLNKGSSVLAYSSISSLLGLKTKLAYAISKSALNSAVMNLAVELTSKQIRVNAILKGALTTDMN